MLLNSKCSEKNRPEELRELFDYINGKMTDTDNNLKKSVSDKWIESLHRRVIMLNEDPEVKKIMTLDEYWKIRTEESYEIRLEEVREEGREEGRQETALKLKNKGLSADIISEVTGLTVEEISKL